jgi:hypothetical protein
MAHHLNSLHLFIFHPLFFPLNSTPIASPLRIPFFLSFKALDAPLICLVVYRQLRSTPRMPSVYQILFVSAHAASVASMALPSTLSSSTLAKPVSRPLLSQTMPMHHITERSVQALISKNLNSKAKAIVPRDILSNPSNLSYYPFTSSTHTVSRVIAGAYSRSGDINTVTDLDNFNILNGYYSKAYGNAQTLST